MSKSQEQILDVNHFDNTVVVKFEAGKVALLNGAAVRHADDAASEKREQEAASNGGGAGAE